MQTYKGGKSQNKLHPQHLREEFNANEPSPNAIPNHQIPTRTLARQKQTSLPRAPPVRTRRGGDRRHETARNHGRIQVHRALGAAGARGGGAHAFAARGARRAGRRKRGVVEGRPSAVGPSRADHRRMERLHGVGAVEAALAEPGIDDRERGNCENES